MKDKLQALLENHRQLSSEVFHMLNELNKTDLTDVSEHERHEMKLSIQELELEYSLRRSFLAELETLV